MALVEGATFAGFTIVQLLGSGSVSDVYLVEHPRLPRGAALKVLNEELSRDPDFRDRFHQSSRLTAALRHPDIVGVLDRGESSGHLWLLTDYVDGPDAGMLLRHRYPTGMPAAGALMIVTAVAKALDHAHQHGLLHGHVTPANILLFDPYSDNYRILLTDFGIADPAVGARTTPLNYAAPEQFSDTDVDGRADQYGLAAATLHLFTGAATMLPRNGTPPRLAKTHPEHAALDPVLARALATHPADRFGSCLDFADALARADAGGAPITAVRATEPSPTRASRKPATTQTKEPRASAKTRLLRPTTVAYTLIAATLVAVLTFAALHYLGGSEPSAAPPPRRALSQPSPRPPRRHLPRGCRRHRAATQRPCSPRCHSATNSRSC